MLHLRILLLQAHSIPERHLDYMINDSAENDAGHLFGLIAYEGAYYGNIGDEIQSLATLRFLPRVDYLIPIDKLHSFRSPTGRPVKVVMNGWFSSDPDAWPPSADIEPLFLSFHLSGVGLEDAPYSGPNAGKAAADVWLVGENLEYLKRVGPVGCRDLSTLHRLQEVGVESYFSGCLTLTLRSKLKQRMGQIAIVDVNADLDALLATAPREVRSRIVLQSHLSKDPADWSQPMRFAKAQELVWLYSSCSLCITSRLHCALPCLALGTPVIYVTTGRDPARLEGLEPLLNAMRPRDLADLRWTDWMSPAPNPDAYLALRELLVRRCSEFCE